MKTLGQKYRIRFFFDYGAGDCVWANNDLAQQDFGIGPIDKIVADKTGKLSSDILIQIEDLELR